MTTMVEAEEGLNQGVCDGMDWDFCCHIRPACLSLRFASESLLLYPPFTKLSWSYKTESEKGLTSYVRWKVEPCNHIPFIWNSVIEYGVILDGDLILSNHFNDDSGLPCIEVLVRHVLTLCVGKGFAHIISIIVYVVVDGKWEVHPLFKTEDPHLGTLCHFFYPKFPLDWSGLDDQALLVLQGSSSRLIVSSTLVAELVTFWVAMDAVSHEAFGMVSF
ncbi:unnamed protein product [Arabidopsis lyrata]|nr:unnamed protein product [Arabidopsis lyrata]